MKELTFEMIEPYINKNIEEDKYIIYCDTKNKKNMLFKICKINIKNLSYYDKYDYFYLYYIKNKINIVYTTENYFGKIIFKIKYDDLFKERENKMKYGVEKGYIELNGNRVKLTKEQMEKLFGKDNPYEYKENEEFYCSSSKFVITCENFSGEYNKNWYEIGNYCKDKDLKIQDTLHDLLRSKLRQFSMLNGGLDIKEYRYGIVKVPYDGYTVYIHNYNPYAKSSDIYFIDEETTQRAINEIIIPFEKEYPKFVW